LPLAILDPRSVGFSVCARAQGSRSCRATHAIFHEVETIRRHSRALPQWVSAEALAQAFGAAGASVQLIVLNACHSDVQAAGFLVSTPDGDLRLHEHGACDAAVALGNVRIGDGLRCPLSRFVVRSPGGHARHGLAPIRRDHEES
jgi:hypothetical protein